MTNLQIALERYIFDQENPLANFYLGKEYDLLGQSAAAISFYLRAAERTHDDGLAYICQIRIAQLFDKQGRRERTVQNILKNAIAFKPDRPEAYYIYSRFSEARGDHVTAYMMACVGLNCSSRDANPFINYVGPYGLLFQKAVSAWWVGKPKESRMLFRMVADNYLSQLDDAHFKAVERNLYFLGSGPDEVSFKEYTREKYDALRFKFPGAETIERGYGQVMQDMFILAALDGKRNGVYLEIGSSFSYRGNNTVLLEQQFGWTGVGIEYDEKYLDEYYTNRKNPIIHQDALTVDYDELLSKYAVNGSIDYLQLDCDPPNITYAIMEKIPFDKYKFAVITYEHDHYLDMTKSYRDKSRKFLKDKGYVLVVPNVSPDDITPFEDWWVHPDLIDPNTLSKLKVEGNMTTDISEYMFSKD
jgi:hypothetical protein